MYYVLSTNAPVIYLITVQGTLDDSWSSWFGDLAIDARPNGETVLVGPVRDQAALHGILGKIRDMGLPLLALERQTEVRTAESNSGFKPLDLNYREYGS